MTIDDEQNNGDSKKKNATKKERKKRTQNDRVTGRARGRQQKYKDKEEMVYFFSVNQLKDSLLTQRIHLMSHLYSYVRSRYLSEWDGQGIFLQYTERYTIWT